MDSVKDKTFTVYMKYAIPSVFGMLAISSASIVDGYFVGNYVGAVGLAAINLSMPVFSLLFGFALMLAIGSSVVSGKLMAEGHTNRASVIFTKTLISMIILSILITSLIYFNIANIISLFNVTPELYALVDTYLSYLLIFIPFLMVGLVMDYFVKIDNRPSLAFFALLLSALLNVILDWFLIVYLEKGILGAALATGISQLALIIVLLPHFFSEKAAIRFVKPIGSWKEILKAGSNGASEFVNEMSVGITTLIFNFILLRSLGVEGLAAYTVVNYILMISIMISFGISDSLQPIISKNFGAKKPERIKAFLQYASVTVTFVGLAIVTLVLLVPEILIEIFLESSDDKTIEIVLKFLALIWPVFLFNGINMVISAYFTALHRPIESATIALSRSLVLPAFFIIVLPHFFGESGLFIAIPISEFLTLLLALYLFNSRRPVFMIK